MGIFRQGASGGREEHGEFLEIGPGLVLTQNAAGQPLLSTGTQAPGTAPGLGPNGLTDVEYWFKADSLLPTLSDTAKVSFWGDQSGNARHAVEADVAEQPIFKTNAINGYPVVEFAGSVQDIAGQILTIGAVGAVTARTVFLVARRTGAYDNVDHFLTWGPIGGGGASILDNAGVWGFHPTEGATVHPLGGNCANFTIVAINCTSGTSAQGYLNGAVAGASFNPDDKILGAGQVIIAAESDSSDRAIAGQFAEILSIRRSLNPADMASVTSYMGSKYAIAVT